MAIPMKAETASKGEIMEAVLMKGDLSKLTPEERTSYYLKLCESIGLNPMTKPMEYITLGGKLVLYAKRDAADQLRKINGISIQILSHEFKDGLLSVHVKAQDRSGRYDEDLGVVALPDTLKGEARANQILKAVTKAKRRCTLSISGLGFLDETEVEDIPASAKKPVAKPNVMLPHDPETGEVPEELLKKIEASAPQGNAAGKPAPADNEAPAGAGEVKDGDLKEIEAFDRQLGDAAKAGSDELLAVWTGLPRYAQATLKASLDRRHKPRAIEADAMARS